MIGNPDDVLEEEIQENLISLTAANEKLVQTAVVLLFIFMGLYFIVGVTSYNSLDGWSSFDSFYFAVITFTTVGK